MKDGYRFVDCDMHIMEPTDLFDEYLDPAFKQRVTSSPRPTNSGAPECAADRCGFLTAHRSAMTGTFRNITAHAGRSSPPAPTPTSCLLSSVGTTPKLKSWAWRWRGSTLPFCSPRSVYRSSLATTWIHSCLRLFAGLTTTGCTISVSTALTN
jgi:hypothetical protein